MPNRCPSLARPATLDGERQWLRAALLLACLLVAGVPAVAMAQPADEPQPAADPHCRAVLIRFEGTILPYPTEVFFRALERAKQLEPDVLIIEIDSPGGLLDESKDLAERLRDVKWARTVAWIPRQALSGAALMALGCDDIVMKPTARIGDAGPIVFGEDGLFRHADAKTKSDLAPFVRDLAEAKGRSPGLVEAMIDHKLVVVEYKNRNTGQTAYMTQPEFDQLANPGDWQKVRDVFETRQGRFLEVVGKRAAELGLAAAPVDDLDQLEQRYRIIKPVKVMKYTWTDDLVWWLNTRFVTILLFVIGLIALYIELHFPGIGVAGAAAALCFALFFWSRYLGGTADLLEILLFVAGIGFICMEIFVLPGFGISGIGGLLLITVSIVLADQRHLIPADSYSLRTMGSTLFVMVASGGVFSFVAAVLRKYFPKMPLFGQLILAPPEPEAPADENATAEGAPDVPRLQIGDRGVAKTALRPAGKASFQGKWHDVVTDSSFVNPGQQVEIVEHSGNRIVVREIGTS